MRHTHSSNSTRKLTDFFFLIDSKRKREKKPYEFFVINDEFSSLNDQVSSLNWCDQNLALPKCLK